MAAGSRTMYALFGAGMHGRNGMNPIVSKQLWIVYIIPIMLFGVELWKLNKGEVEKLELFQRGKVKQIQGLPTRTATAATLGLIGILPIQAEIHKRVLCMLET